MMSARKESSSRKIRAIFFSLGLGEQRENQTQHQLMITTTTISATIEQQFQQPPQPSSFSSSSTSSSRTTILTGLKLQDEQLEQQPQQSNEVNLEKLSPPSSEIKREKAPELILSPKVGEWSEGSSYPSGFGIRIDSRSHLEVFDQRHRYGKNLRRYYKEWVKRQIELQFFDWLNSPNLPEVS
jgi:hypothetical protein